MATLVLVRHGETEWSLAGRHTGLTDVGLTERGRAQARDLAGRLAVAPGLVLASPLQRAWLTATLAGLRPTADERLVEWDYGGFEGLTTAEVRATGRPGWTVVRDGVVPGATPGETVEQVAARAAGVVADVAPLVAAGQDVVLVAHGHLLRVLATVWLGLPPVDAAMLSLGPASISRLGEEHDVPAILSWNERG